MTRIETALVEFDETWEHPRGGKILLHTIGSIALMLQSDYERGTKDTDILQTNELDRELQDRILGHAGKGSALHTRHRLYFEFVANGLPFLPQAPRWVDISINARLRHFEFKVLHVLDVVVSKLKRFSDSDRADINAMVDLGLVPHAPLIERFRDAFEYSQLSAFAADLPRVVANLNRVERDILFVDETRLELPESA
jgi:hypothetical protein